jgi:hypothetical protein
MLAPTGRGDGREAVGEERIVAVLRPLQEVRTLGGEPASQRLIGEVSQKIPGLNEGQPDRPVPLGSPGELGSPGLGKARQLDVARVDAMSQPEAQLHEQLERAVDAGDCIVVAGLGRPTLGIEEDVLDGDVGIAQLLEVSQARPASIRLTRREGADDAGELVQNSEPAVPVASVQLQKRLRCRQLVAIPGVEGTAEVAGMLEAGAQGCREFALQSLVERGRRFGVIEALERETR